MALPGRVVATFLRGTPTVLDGKTALEGKTVLEGLEGKVGA
jgi:hypothetical protein